MRVHHLSLVTPRSSFQCQKAIVKRCYKGFATTLPGLASGKSSVLVLFCSTSNKRKKTPKFKTNVHRWSTQSRHKWPWGITYGSIVGWMNIHLPPILMFTGLQGFDPQPNHCVSNYAVPKATERLFEELNHWIFCRVFHLSGHTPSDQRHTTNIQQPLESVANKQERQTSWTWNQSALSHCERTKSCTI